jgi:Tfp pilus assembly protein PilN
MGLTKWYEKELVTAMEKQPLAEEVQQKADILAKINQITTNQLLPFEMLDAVNQVPSDDIYFTRVSTEGDDTLKIEAVTLNSSEINQYENALKETGFLSSVEISNFRDQKGRGTFRLRVVFKPGSLQPKTFLTDS